MLDGSCPTASSRQKSFTLCAVRKARVLPGCNFHFSFWRSGICGQFFIQASFFLIFFVIILSSVKITLE